jgi:hypothetical protein
MREVSRTAPLTLNIVIAGLVPADRDHRDNPSQPLVAATSPGDDKRGLAEGRELSAATTRLSHAHA